MTKDVEFQADFSGGGVCSSVGLGGYTIVREEIGFKKFSGASIGALNATCLAAKREAEEILDFLLENVESFCLPILGQKKIQRQVDSFLGGILFKDLPQECFVAITPMRRNFPQVITRENAGNLTAGEVVALSAAMPGLFLPGFVALEGKHAFVLDGGIAQNPPLNPAARNIIFSYNNSGSLANTFWNRRRWAQEAKAHAVFHPYVRLGVLGGKAEVKEAFRLGQEYMREEKRSFLIQVECARL